MSFIKEFLARARARVRIPSEAEEAFLNVLLLII